MPRRWQWLRTAGRLALFGVLLVWGLLLAAWLALHWAILPHIDEWRPRIEAAASRAVGLRLSIGAIQVQSSGWVPTLRLRDLRVFDPQGREALVLGEVSTALAPQSLLSLTLRFQQVLIDGARLQVRRDAQGRVHVAGLDWEGSVGSSDTRARDWFLRQPEFIVRHAELHWTDERSRAPPLVLSQVDVVLRNGPRRHELRLDATPPADWGQRFTLRGRFTQPLLAPVGELDRWSGTLYAEFPQVDAAQLHRHLTLPFDLGGGEGALRAWLDIAEGSARRATLDFALRAVALQLAPTLRTLQLDQLQGRLDARRQADGMRLQVGDLTVLTRDGRSWPGGDFSVAWRQAQNLREPWPAAATPITGGDLQAQGLDLDLLAQLAEHLPMADTHRNWLAGLAPQGRVDSLQLRWDGALEAPEHYQLKARLADVALRAAPDPGGRPGRPGRPGVQRAQIQLSADENGGDARLTIKDGGLVFPGLWEQEELPLESLDAMLGWRISSRLEGPPALTLELKKLSLANADLQGEGHAVWHSGAAERFPGHLELGARLQRVRATSVARYLPLAIHAPARDYVQAAVQGGSVSSAAFKLQGNLADFPFRDPRQGEFRITLQVKDLRYAFAPGRSGDPPSTWPVVEQASGEIEFERHAMHLRGLQGQILGYHLQDVGGGIAELGTPQAELMLQGHGKGPASDLLRFARLLPLGTRADTLAGMQAGGASELQLGLTLPLAHGAKAVARGSVQLPGNDLRLHPDLPPLSGVRGAIDFSPQGLQLRGLTARLLGGDTAIDGTVGSDGTLRFSAQGLAAADALRTSPLPALARAGSLMRGQAAWRGTLAVADGRSEFTLSSNLVGMTLDLPPPLGKAAAGSALPLRLQVGPAADGGSARNRDSLQLDLGDVLKARFERDLSTAEPRVLRGAMAVQDALPALPAGGVQAALNLGRVDVDAWQAVAERGGLAVDGAHGANGGFMPQTIQLRADELHSGARVLSHVNATLTRQGGPDDALWRAQVQAEQLAGELQYRAAPDSRLTARLQRLSLPQTEVATVESLLSQPPANVPALDVVVDDFELRGRRLGKLQVQAVNRPLPARAGVREWQLDRLALTMPEAQLEASGRWSPLGARRMALDFKLDLNDSGAFLDRLGAGQSMRGGKGRLQGQLSWAGSPLTLDYPSLGGQLRLDVDAGQFLHAEVGSARLLGVLSLSALPRRLSLDFRDLFQQGFAFDSIEGDVKVTRGVAETSNLQMRGAQATVLMQGSADLLRETQDLRVLIVPDFDATGAALATMAINPAIGLGTLFAQWALREPLIAAGTSELHITGSWADPQVQRVAGPVQAPAATPSLPVPPSSPLANPTEKRPPG